MKAVISSGKGQLYNVSRLIRYYRKLTAATAGRAVVASCLVIAEKLFSFLRCLRSSLHSYLLKNYFVSNLINVGVRV